MIGAAQSSVKHLALSQQITPMRVTLGAFSQHMRILVSALDILPLSGKMGCKANDEILSVFEGIRGRCRRSTSFDAKPEFTCSKIILDITHGSFLIHQHSVSSTHDILHSQFYPLTTSSSPARHLYKDSRPTHEAKSYYNLSLSFQAFNHYVLHRI